MSEKEIEQFLAKLRVLIPGANQEEMLARLVAGPKDEQLPDASTAQAMEQLMWLFNARREEVFYERQLLVFFEQKGDEIDLRPMKIRERNSEKEVLIVAESYFHWVTARALRKLEALGAIASHKEKAKTPDEEGSRPMRFYRHPTHRYWKRQAKNIKTLVSEFSDPTFSRAMGNQAEVLFDSALAREGFLPVACHEATRDYKGREYRATPHNLDRIYERDGIAWGAEIKNTLSYIPPDEFRVKLEMCRQLNIKPLFITRAMPKTYIREAWRLGGFCLVFGKQLYPFGQEDLARRVATVLELPVHTPRTVPEGDIRRFVEWHKRQVQKQGAS